METMELLEATFQRLNTFEGTISQWRKLPGECQQQNQQVHHFHPDHEEYEYSKSGPHLLTHNMKIPEV